MPPPAESYVLNAFIYDSHRGEITLESGISAVLYVPSIGDGTVQNVILELSFPNSVSLSDDVKLKLLYLSAKKALDGNLKLFFSICNGMFLDFEECAYVSVLSYANVGALVLSPYKRIDYSYKDVNAYNGATLSFPISSSMLNNILKTA